MLGYTITVKRPQISEDELMHWGVLGMKWGIRRYQNPDGSLTDEGRKHYGIHAARIDKKFAKAQSKRDRAAEYRSKAANARYKSDKAARGGFLRRPNEAKAARLNSDYLKNEKKAARLERQAARLEKKGRKMVKNANWYFDEVRTNDVDSKTLAIGKRHALNILDEFTEDFKKTHPSNNQSFAEEKTRRSDGTRKLVGQLKDAGFTNPYPDYPDWMEKDYKVGSGKAKVVYDAGSYDVNEKDSMIDLPKNIDKSVKRYNDKDVRNQLAKELVSDKRMGFDGVSVKDAANDMVLRSLTVDRKGEISSVWYDGNDEMTYGHSIEAEYRYDPKTKKQKLYYVSLQG